MKIQQRNRGKRSGCKDWPARGRVGGRDFGTRDLALPNPRSNELRSLRELPLLVPTTRPLSIISSLSNDSNDSFLFFFLNLAPILNINRISPTISSRVIVAIKKERWTSRRGKRDDPLYICMAPAGVPDHFGETTCRKCIIFSLDFRPWIGARNIEEERGWYFIRLCVAKFGKLLGRSRGRIFGD